MNSIIYFLCTLSTVCVIVMVAKLATLLVDPFHVVWRFSQGDKQPWERMKGLGIYNLGYPLIPVLLMVVLVMCSQLNIGNVKIRMDISFFIQTAFWILFLPLVIVLINRDQKRKK